MSEPASNSDPVGKPVESQRFTYCRLCEAGCGLIAHLEGERLVRVQPDHEHAYSQGFCCGKSQAMVEITYDPERLQQPLVRRSDTGQLAPASWDEALDLCALRFHEVLAAHGPDSIATLTGNPPYFASGGNLFQAGFNARLGLTRHYGINSEDAAARLTANEALYGNPRWIPRPDFWRTDLAILIGANPLVSRGSRMSEPLTRKALDSVIARGGRVIVIDPRATETARRYEHISVIPGTDPWLLAGVCRAILDAAGTDDDFLQTHVSGFDEFRDHLASLDLEQCATECGVAVEMMRELATAVSRAGSTVVYGSTGTCSQRFGTLTNILQDAIMVLTGSIDREGGVQLGWDVFDTATNGKMPLLSGTRRTRAEGRPEVSGQLPSAGLAADITVPGDDRIRAVFNRGCNAVLTSGGGGSRLEEALEQLDFHVAMDLYLNETNKSADVVLPVVGMYERQDYPTGTSNGQLRPTSYATDAVIAPVGDSRNEWWIYDEIARRMGFEDGACPDPVVAAEARQRGIRPTPVDVIDRMLAAGHRPDLTFQKILDEHPRGLALLSHLPTGPFLAGLKTPDGRIRLNSDVWRQETQALMLHRSDARYPLRMIGRRDKGSQNSWMHNSARLFPDDFRFVALAHPDDAADAGVADGDTVRLVSASGSIDLPVRLSTGIRRGVVSIPNGWGHAGGGWSRANRHGGANSNELVSPVDTEKVAGMSILNGVPIAMEAISADD